MKPSAHFFIQRARSDMKKNKLSKESIANAIMSAASIYKQNLVGKIALFWTFEVRNSSQHSRKKPEMQKHAALPFVCSR